MAVAFKTQLEKMSIEEVEKQVMAKGKHKGKEIGDVMLNDPEYCTWILQHKKNDVSGEWAAMLVYMDKLQGTGTSSSSKSPAGGGYNDGTKKGASTKKGTNVNETVTNKIAAARDAAKLALAKAQELVDSLGGNSSDDDGFEKVVNNKKK
jgi:hypothetical protein